MRSVNVHYVLNTISREEAEMIEKYRRSREQEKDAHYARLVELGLLSIEPLSFGQKFLRLMDSTGMFVTLFFLCSIPSYILGKLFSDESEVMAWFGLLMPFLLFFLFAGFKDEIFGLFGWKIKYTRDEQEHQDAENTFGV